MPSFAHQSDLSTMMLYQDDKGRSFLQIYSSLTAFQGEIDYHFSPKAYKTPEEFRSLVAQFFRKNVMIVLNDKDTLRFAKPQIILGHETKLVAEVFGFPKKIKSLFLSNTFFKDIPRNQSAVLVMQKGLPYQQFILNNENKQQVYLLFSNGKWIPKVEEVETKSWGDVIGFVAILILGFATYFFNRKNRVEEVVL